MSDLVFDPLAPKKAANLTVNADLLRQARELEINLSQTLEKRLAEIIRNRKAAQWLIENRAAIDAYNEHIERDGVFSEGLRGF